MALKDSKLPHTSKKQKEILKLILKFRYLKSKQIQTTLNHKDPKTINTWLKKLTDNNYLKRDYIKTFGEAHIPAIYYIGLNGLRYLKEQKLIDSNYAKKLYADKDKSDKFKNHHIFLADISLELKEDTKFIYTYMSQSELWKYEELKELKTDSYIKKSKPKGVTRRYLLHLFDKYVKDFLLEYKIKQYLKFYYSDKWKEVFAYKKFPTVLFILPNTQKLSIIRNAIKKSHPQFNISLTTRKEVETKGFTADIWEEID